MTKFKDVANRAAKRTDQTQTKTGGEAFPIPAAGGALARLVDYIEIGVHPQKAFKGKAKAPAAKALLTFELTGPKYTREIEVDGVKKKVADRISLPAIPISLHEKAGFKKLFKKMTYGRQDINHMAQMLGDAFLLEIVHNEVGEGADKKVYANITDSDGNYLVSGPFEIDKLAGTTKKYKVPEAIGNERLFIWDEPTQECWDSLFIDGDREVKDEKGNTKTVSKNWIQNTITSALNFEGSPVQTFLEGSSSLPEDPSELVEDEEEYAELDSEVEEVESEFEEEVEEVVEPVKQTKTTKAKAPAKKPAVAPTEDPLAALGLV